MQQNEKRQRMLKKKAHHKKEITNGLNEKTFNLTHRNENSNCTEIPLSPIRLENLQ